MYKTLKTVFHRISEHLEVRQEYSTARRVVNFLQCLEIFTNHCLSYLIHYVKLGTNLRLCYVGKKPRKQLKVARTYLCALWSHFIICGTLNEKWLNLRQDYLFFHGSKNVQDISRVLNFIFTKMSIILKFDDRCFSLH